MDLKRNRRSLHSLRSGRDDKFVAGESLTPLTEPAVSCSTNLSSRPERTRISYIAIVRNDHACDSPQREAHELYQRHYP
jgi:hypothetical protein